MLADVAERIGSSGTAVAVAFVSMVAIYLAIVVATRVAGPRSLARMSAFDFIATVAIGSMAASDGEVYEDHLRAARLTHDDLRQHLRQADVTDIGVVRAVILETTGEVSVLQGDGDLGPVLQGVRGAEGHRGPRGRLSPG